MGEWTRLIPLNQIEPDAGRYVEAGGRALAVFRVQAQGATEQVVVMDDACPHAGAPLSAGRIEDGCVHCALHGWAFRLQDGRCPDNDVIGVRVYPSRIVHGVVEACLT